MDGFPQGLLSSYWREDGQATANDPLLSPDARERLRRRGVRSQWAGSLVARFLRLRDDRPITNDERELVLRFAFVIAIPLATIVAAALLIGLFWGRHQLNNQIKSNRGAIAATRQLANDLNTERKDREVAIAKAVRQIARASFNECVENEAQDAANAALFRKVRVLVLQGPQTEARDVLLDAITDTINAREPSDEKPCKLPGAGS